MSLIKRLSSITNYLKSQPSAKIWNSTFDDSERYILLVFQNYMDMWNQVVLTFKYIVCTIAFKCFEFFLTTVYPKVQRIESSFQIIQSRMSKLFTWFLQKFWIQLENWLMRCSICGFCSVFFSHCRNNFYVH